MVKRFVEEVQLGGVDVRTGAAAGIASLTQKLEGFKQSTEQAQTAIGERLGAEEAAGVEFERDPITGQTKAPERRKATVGDILLTGGARTAAFNKTVRDGYLASLENDLRLDLSKIEQENPDNINVFNDKIEGLRSGTLKSVDPSARQAVQEFLDKQITNARIRVQGKTLERQEIASQQDISDAIKTATDQAVIEARGGQGAASAETIKDAFAHIDGLLETDKITAIEAKDSKRAIKIKVESSSALGNIERIADTVGVDAAFKALDDIPSTPREPFTQIEWDAFKERTRTHLTRIRSIKAGAKEKSGALAVDALKDYQTAVALGIDVSAGERERVSTLVSNSPELQKAFEITNRVAAFSLLPASERRAVLGQAETGQLEDVDQIAATIKANRKVEKFARTDGYAFGVRQGLIDNIPFDPSDPESYKIKVDQAEFLSNHYGLPVSPLSDSEATAIGEAITKMTTPEKIQLAGTLSTSPEVWGQVSKKQQRVFSLAGATGDVNLMATVFKGQDLIDGGLVKTPTPAEFLPVLNDTVEDIYGADDKQSVLQAAVAHYAATVEDPTVFDGSAFESSIEAVTGGIGEVNGFKIELPRGVSEDDFDDFIDSYTEETVARLGGVVGFTDAEAAERIQDSRIKSVGDNKYIVMVDGSSALFTKDGEPLIISFDPGVLANMTAERAVRRRKQAQELRRFRSL